jgi:hypothetical protein
LSEPVIGRWAAGEREKKLAVVLLMFGLLALFTSVTIAMMAIGAGKFLRLPAFLLTIPVWGTIAVMLAVLLLSATVRPRLFIIGTLWLLVGLLPAVWAEFLA